MDIKIREIDLADAADAAVLSGQFGYHSTAEVMAVRIAALATHPHDHAWVADHGGRLIGWIQATRMLRLESGEFCEITGLVVETRARGGGVGRSLVAHVHAWAQAQGLQRVVVRMNVLRTETRGFYNRLGFVERKQQLVFELPAQP
jgi:N-acetylglutamate synthase-like GNAT family acetyltransferase